MHMWRNYHNCKLKMVWNSSFIIIDMIPSCPNNIYKLIIITTPKITFHWWLFGAEVSSTPSIRSILQTPTSEARPRPRQACRQITRYIDSNWHALNHWDFLLCLTIVSWSGRSEGRDCIDLTPVKPLSR